MATSDEVKRIIGQIGANPSLLNQLLGTRDENAAKATLVNSGLVSSSESGPNQEQIQQEIMTLLQGVGPAPAAGERMVEWVAAIGTAAAGAAAGACSAE
jgi:hypothetical protein